MQALRKENTSDRKEETDCARAGFLPTLLDAILGTVIAKKLLVFYTAMNKFIKNIFVVSFLNNRDYAPVGRDTTGTVMGRLLKAMSGLLEDPTLLSSQKI